MIIILQLCGSSQTEKVREKPKTNSKSELYFNLLALSIYEQDRFFFFFHEGGAFSICHNTCPHIFTMNMQHFKL